METTETNRFCGGPTTKMVNFRPIIGVDCLASRLIPEPARASNELIIFIYVDAGQVLQEIFRMLSTAKTGRNSQIFDPIPRDNFFAIQALKN